MSSLPASEVHKLVACALVLVSPHSQVSLCRNIQTKGVCFYGSKCHFAHTKAEQRGEGYGPTPEEAIRARTQLHPELLAWWRNVRAERRQLQQHHHHQAQGAGDEDDAFSAAGAARQLQAAQDDDEELRQLREMFPDEFRQQMQMEQGGGDNGGDNGGWAEVGAPAASAAAPAPRGSLGGGGSAAAAPASNGRRSAPGGGAGASLPSPAHLQGTAQRARDLARDAAAFAGELRAAVGGARRQAAAAVPGGEAGGAESSQRLAVAAIAFMSSLMPGQLSMWEVKRERLKSEGRDIVDTIASLDAQVREGRKWCHFARCLRAVSPSLKRSAQTSNASSLYPACPAIAVLCVAGGGAGAGAAGTARTGRRGAAGAGAGARRLPLRLARAGAGLHARAGAGAGRGAHGAAAAPHVISKQGLHKEDVAALTRFLAPAMRLGFVP